MLVFRRPPEVAGIALQPDRDWDVVDRVDLAASYAGADDPGPLLSSP